MLGFWFWKRRKEKFRQLAEVQAMMPVSVVSEAKPEELVLSTVGPFGRFAIDPRTEAERPAGLNPDDVDPTQRPGTPERYGALGERAPHNPHQQLITKAEAEGRTATELIAGAGESMPALVSAMQTIAERFESSVQATHALNQGLMRFRDDIVVPLREELKALKFDLVDRTRASVTDLSVYVEKLDKVIWAALRAAGKSDAEIRAFRESEGMQPEAPRGEELEAHMREFEELKGAVRNLTLQNRRLIARLGGHWFTPGEGDWSLKKGCPCEVCRAENQRLWELERAAEGKCPHPKENRVAAQHG